MLFLFFLPPSLGVFIPFLDFDFFFVLFLCFLVFLLLLQFFWSSPCLLGILGFVEPPSIMTEFPHYCWSYYRNRVCWLMMIFHPLLGAEEVGGDVVVGDQFHNCCYWRSMNMCMAVTVIQTPIQFCFGLCFLFCLGLGFLFLIVAEWLLLCCQIWNIHKLIVGSSLNSFQVVSMERFSILMEVFLLHTVLLAIHSCSYKATIECSYLVPCMAGPDSSFSSAVQWGDQQVCIQCTHWTCWSGACWCCSVWWLWVWQGKGSKRFSASA